MKNTITKITLLSLFSTVSHATLHENDGILVSDMKLDTIYLTRDLNGNGTASDAGESIIYFNGDNQSGLVEPSKSIFSIHQSNTGYIYLGDGGSDSVYRLADRNADGDAQDLGEANIWFSSANANSYSLPTPNSIFEANDNALYIVNAGTRSQPADAVYRTVDLNNDGDANDSGESSIWLDLSTLASTQLGGDIPENKSSAFDITFVGDTAYIADLMGGETNTIFRAQDNNSNGIIDTDELTVFIDGNNEYDVPVATGLISDHAGALYTLESSSRQEQTLFRLTDINSDGTINDVSEVLEIWNESLVTDLGVELGSAFGMALGPEGEILITSAGRDNKDNLFRLLDLNGDNEFVDFARTSEYINISTPLAITAVPLPPALLLFGSSMGLLLLRRTKERA